MRTHQLQYRILPDGPWRYHSTVAEDEGRAGIAAYKHSTFEYRLVALDSKDALAKPAPAVVTEGTMPIDFRNQP